MRLSSLIIRALLLAASLGAPVATLAQRAGPPPAPPPPTAPSYRVTNEATAPAGWKRYEFGASPVISVLLPGVPEEFTEQKPLGGAKPSTMRFFTSGTDTAVYAAYYAEDLPFVAERMPQKFKESFYDGMLQGFINGVKEGLSESGLLFDVKAGARREMKFAGLDAVDFDFTFGPMLGMGRMAISGQRAYMAISMWTEETPQSERAAFFNSFRILKR